jgi:APA family basic amino acid/polyamine antiporter
VFRSLGIDWVAAIVYIGALVATLNTVLILMLGQSRVAFAMARDPPLPSNIGTTHPRFGTPHKITLITMVVVAILPGSCRSGRWRRS